jgi:hypothetical protein
MLRQLADSFFARHLESFIVTRNFAANYRDWQKTRHRDPSPPIGGSGQALTAPNYCSATLSIRRAVSWQVSTVRRQTLYLKLCYICKKSSMTVSDLKLKIFRQIDSLEKNRLEEFYGLLMNYVNSKKDISDWEKLSELQKQGILDAIDELDSKKGVANKVVIDKFRKKYSNV